MPWFVVIEVDDAKRKEKYNTCLKDWSQIYIW